VAPHITAMVSAKLVLFANILCCWRVARIGVSANPPLLVAELLAVSQWQGCRCNDTEGDSPNNALY
jgi:hypothetical protein